MASGTTTRPPNSKTMRLKAASDGKGTLYINNEGTNTMQVVDAKTMKVKASWKLDGCDGPTGIAIDRGTNRIFAGCSKQTNVVDAKSGKVVSKIANGDGHLGHDRGAPLDPGVVGPARLAPTRAGEAGGRVAARPPVLALRGGTPYTRPTRLNFLLCVARIRARHASRKAPWTAKELADSGR